MSGLEMEPTTGTDAPPAKRARVDESEGGEEDGFRGLAASSSSTSSGASSERKPPPLLPRDYKHLLLDIEGCTTSIAFVHDELFPFARKQLRAFAAALSEESLQAHEEALRADVAKLDADTRAKCFPQLLADAPDDAAAASVSSLSLEECVTGLMDHDVKAAGLKALQGCIWKDGYASGALKGHCYADTVAALQWCDENGVACSIYSSGSVGAQKLLFGNTSAGDLLPLLGGRHFDITTSGHKKEASSYLSIAKSLGVDPADIVFGSDSEAELIAAREAGIGCPVMTVRPGNAPLTPAAEPFPRVESLLQLCGCD